MVTEYEGYIEELPLDAIHSPKFPMRTNIPTSGLEELAASIRTHGIISPIQVRPRGGIYEVIAGDRRVAASRLAGLRHIPATVVDIEDDEATSRTIHENLYREQVNIWDEANYLTMALDRLGIDPPELARRIGRSVGYVLNRVDLLVYDEDIQHAVKIGKMGLGVASLLMKIEKPESRKRYTSYAIEHPITDRIAKIWVREANAGTSYEEMPKTPEAINERPAGSSSSMVDCRLCLGKLEAREAKFFFAHNHCIAAIDEVNIKV